MTPIEQAREALTAIRKASAMDAVVMSAPPAAVSRFADMHQHADAALAALSPSTPVDGVGAGDLNAKPDAYGIRYNGEGYEFTGDVRFAASPDDELQRYIVRCKELSNDGEYTWWTRLAEILSALAPPEAEARLRERVWEANVDAGRWEDAHRELLNVVLACCDPDFAVCGLRPGPERDALEAVIRRQRTFHAKGLPAAEARLAQAEGGPTVTEARPLDEWHEDYGDAVWWTWQDGQWLGEPSYIGGPNDSDWPGYHTHWSPHPAFPAALHPQSAAGEEG